MFPQGDAFAAYTADLHIDSIGKKLCLCKGSEKAQKRLRKGSEKVKNVLQRLVQTRQAQSELVQIKYWNQTKNKIQLLLGVLL